MLVNIIYEDDFNDFCRVQFEQVNVVLSLFYYLLMHTTYDLSNPYFQPIVSLTPNAHFFGFGSPNPQILVRTLGRQIRQGRCATAARNRPTLFRICPRCSFSSAAWRPKFRQFA